MKEMLKKYELLSKATNSVGSVAENPADVMTADFRRSGQEHNAIEDETSKYIRLMREEKEQRKKIFLNVFYQYSACFFGESCHNQWSLK